MTPRTSIELENRSRFAGTLLDLLVDCGALTAAECCDKLGWTRSRFHSALTFARTELCPTLGIAIPTPTPGRGWQYEATTDWRPVEEGASYSLGQIETRLTALHRDVQIVFPHLERGTRRRANFLKKHLSHVLLTLSEIDNG